MIFGTVEIYSKITKPQTLQFMESQITCHVNEKAFSNVSYLILPNKREKKNRNEI